MMTPWDRARSRRGRRRDQQREKVVKHGESLELNHGQRPLDQDPWFCQRGRHAASTESASGTRQCGAGFSSAV